MKNNFMTAAVFIGTESGVNLTAFRGKCVLWTDCSFSTDLSPLKSADALSFSEDLRG